MSILAEIKKLTIDPGALRLAEIADAQAAQLDALKKRLDDCCPPGGMLTARATPAPAASDAPK